MESNLVFHFDNSVSESPHASVPLKSWRVDWAPLSKMSEFLSLSTQNGEIAGHSISCVFIKHLSPRIFRI